MDFQYELKVACALAQKAGALLMSYHQKFHLQQGQKDKIAIQFKKKDEPVTEADLAINQLCVKTLGELFPQDGMLSEELPDDGSRYQADRTWVIDPIDGTRDFIAGLPGFSIMIGLLAQGKPVLGVVYIPLSQSLFYAVVGQGAFVLQDGKIERIHVSQVEELRAARLIQSRFSSPELQALKQKAHFRHELQMGSIGVKMCLIAQGSYDVYVHFSHRASLWDTCAPEVIVKEAGGKVSNLKGKPLLYHRKSLVHRQGILVCNEKLSPAMYSLLKS